MNANESQKWSRTQLRVAVAVSATSSLIILARLVLPTVIVLDQAMLGLLALAVFPWLTLFFKKLSIPGIGEVETQERIQGATANPLPPVAPVAQVRRAAPASPSPSAMKLLATLWRYQRQSFGGDTTRRWTFRVSPLAPDFPQFLSGLSETVQHGWVAVSPETHQCMLTNEGLVFISGNEEVQKYQDVWTF